jgi:hypothetical protein
LPLFSCLQCENFAKTRIITGDYDFFLTKPILVAILRIPRPIPVSCMTSEVSLHLPSLVIFVHFLISGKVTS